MAVAGQKGLGRYSFHSSMSGQSRGGGYWPDATHPAQSLPPIRVMHVCRVFWGISQYTRGHALVAEEVRQHHMQAQLIPYEYINKDSSCTFYRSLFSDYCFVFVRFQVLLFV